MGDKVEGRLRLTCRPSRNGKLLQLLNQLLHTGSVFRNGIPHEKRNPRVTLLVYEGLALLILGLWLEKVALDHTAGRK